VLCIVPVDQGVRAGATWSAGGSGRAGKCCGTCGQAEWGVRADVAGRAGRWSGTCGWVWWNIQASAVLSTYGWNSAGGCSCYNQWSFCYGGVNSTLLCGAGLWMASATKSVKRAGRCKSI
jgi:hypothetical protein